MFTTKTLRTLRKALREASILCESECSKCLSGKKHLKLFYICKVTKPYEYVSR